MLFVSKFGGSSLADSEQFKKVKNIVKLNENRNVIIVSALGKSKDSDSKITDLLFLLHAHIKYSVPYDNIFNIVKERYIKIANDLNLSLDIKKEFDILDKQLNKDISVDFLASRGEYLCAKIVAEYLEYTFIDAKDIIIFNYNGSVNYKKTTEAVEKAYKEYGHLVIPGFYGATPDGNILLMSRGGSDVTGSIVSKVLKVDMYENWTDVSGILMADPRIIENPKRINQISYTELRELAYMGASVLHEETIIPVQKMNIPINILNTNDPSNPGTVIKKDCEDNSEIITGLSGKKNYTSITVIKKYTSSKNHLIRRVLEVFEKYSVHPEHIPTSIDSFSIIASSEEMSNCLHELVGEIEKDKDVYDVKVDEDIAIIAIVGRNMVTRTGISGTIFENLGGSNINIKMISQGAQEINIILGVTNKDFEKAIRTIYNNIVLNKSV